MRIQIENPTSYRGRNARPNWLALIAFIALSLATGILGALVSPGVAPPAVQAGASVHGAPPAAATSGRVTSETAWYASLNKPAWTPPIALIGRVWTALYVLMGTAAWLAWSERYHPGRNRALFAYGLQLALNALWAPVFYGMKSIGGGLFLIVALWLTLTWTLREFSAVRPAAAWLMLPYLAWISLGVAVNLSIWRTNP